jgi:RNA polymerase sigma factor (TIGR02999 family)
MMSDVTQILTAIENGDPHAAQQLLPLAYEELRKLAAAQMSREKVGQTLDATALVHGACLRLVASPGRESGEAEQSWSGRGHFFAAAAEATRRILVEIARRKQRRRHGGEWKRINLDEAELTSFVRPDELLALNDAPSVGLDSAAPFGRTLCRTPALRLNVGVPNR